MFLTRMHLNAVLAGRRGYLFSLQTYMTCKIKYVSMHKQRSKPI